MLNLFIPAESLSVGAMVVMFFGTVQQQAICQDQ